MVLQPKDLGGSIRPFASSKRLVTIRNKSAKIAAVIGAPKLEALTPIQATLATPGTYEVWDNTRPIVAFVDHVGIQTSAAGEVLGILATEAQLHRDDVPLMGQLQADLDNALRTAALKSSGFHVQGLADIIL